MMDLELWISPTDRLAASTGIASADQFAFNIRGARLSEMLDELEAALRADADGVLESLGAARAQAQEAAERRIREMRILLGLVR